MTTQVEHHQPHIERSLSKPKGILKNAPARNSTGPHLTWDEANLALTEIQKDSLMKITEPKTPYVRYNPITDEVEGFSNVPSFDLDGRPRSPLASPPAFVNSPPKATASELPAGYSSGNSSRRTSFTEPRPGSRGSSRSTSFNLREGERLTSENGEIEVGDELDEQSALKHAEFVRARGRHYSNEAEAMKRAQALMAAEDDEDTTEADTDEKTSDVMEDESDDAPALPPSSAQKMNGV